MPWIEYVLPIVYAAGNLLSIYPLYRIGQMLGRTRAFALFMVGAALQGAAGIVSLFDSGVVILAFLLMAPLLNFGAFLALQHLLSRFLRRRT